MSFLEDLVSFPVSGPLKLVIWIAENVAEQADRQLYDEEALRSQLTDMELRYDLGEITEEQYLAAEAVLLERMQIAHERAAEAEEET